MARIWASGREACRLSGKNIYMLYKLALLGLIRFEAAPGQSVKFHRDDLLAIAKGE